MYGTLPPRPAQVSDKLEHVDRNALGGKATLKEVTITFGPPELRPIYLMLVVPNRREVPAPVVLGMNYFGNHTLLRDPAITLSTNWMPERGTGVVKNLSTETSRGTWADIWSIEYLIDRGYALATFYNGDIDPDRPDARGIQTYFKKLDPSLDCATIAAWAWGLSRAVDYLVTDKEVDRQRIVVTGHSRLGKAALLAAALDERIALAVPHQAGSGGSAPSRTHVKPMVSSRRENAPYPLKEPETVTQLNDKFPHWFNARFKEFNDRPERLPFDQHCLVALCAPRPVLFTNGRDDTWINPDGQFEVLRAAAPVYRLLGAGDFAATNPPPDGHLIDSTLGFFLRPGAHSLKPEDWKAFLDFADKHLIAPASRKDGASLRGPSPETLRSAALPSATAPMIEVPRWEMHEFELHGRSRVENPFRDAALVGEFTAPSGTALRIEGFLDGSDAWRLRFAPTEEGEWRYRLRGEGVAIAREGSLRCIAPRGHGPIRVHPENPYAFAYADGTAFFPMGDTCYGLYDDSPITRALRREYLDTRRRQRFNFVRMSVGHSEARAAADPAFWAWGGTPAKPDLDRLNPVFFRGLDELFRDLKAHGMNVELLLLNFYRRPFTDTSLWTAVRERLWLRYVIARYAAFDNLFLWTLANEYETRPDGRYRLDRPDDVEWAKATARHVKQLDPYRHLVTVHPVVSSSTRGTTPRSEFEPPWRIGGFFGDAEELDVLSQQTSAAYAAEWDSRAQRWVSSCAADPTAPWFRAQWDETRGCWTGDVPGVNRSIAADRIYRKPVLNTENGYEYLPGQPTERKQVHHTDKVRRTSWRIVCAGGYFAAGFNGTIGHNDIWNRIDAANRYTFTVQDTGAAVHLGALFDFFAALPFWRMQPFDGVTGAEAVALAEPGRVYVFYLPHGGKVSVDLSAAKEPLTACWFNPREGSTGDPFVITARKTEAFQAPDSQDWVLCLRNARSRP